MKGFIWFTRLHRMGNELLFHIIDAGSLQWHFPAPIPLRGLSASFFNGFMRLDTFTEKESEHLFVMLRLL